MIFEHKKPHLTAKPNIKFNYISPNTANFFIHRTYIPIQYAQTHIPQSNLRQLQETQTTFKKSERKKIFDRSYTCKNSLKSEYSRQTSNEVIRGKTNTYKQNSKRKPIFTKNKTAHSTDYRSYSKKQFQQSHPSSWLTNHPTQQIKNIAQKQIKTSSLQQSYHPVLQQKIEPLFQSNNLKSEIQVQLTDSNTNKSILNSQNYQFAETEQRFFDKEMVNTPQKHQKLSQVNLYSTSIGRKLNKQYNNSQGLGQRVRKQIKQNIIPMALIVLGFFILMLQSLK